MESWTDWFYRVGLHFLVHVGLRRARVMREGSQASENIRNVCDRLCGCHVILNCRGHVSLWLWLASTIPPESVSRDGMFLG